MDEVTDIESHKLSNDIAVLLDQINTADPNLPDIDKDDSNENWGHAQFTAGGLTIQSTLVDWEAVGSNSMAFKLIAATIRTCKVARAVCSVKGLAPKVFLADDYLELLLEQLQCCWDGVQVSKHCFHWSIC
jgi:hypothetical protein